MVSVFSGPADNASFNRIIKQPFSNQSVDKTASLVKLESLYNRVDQLFDLKALDESEIIAISSELLKCNGKRMVIKIETYRVVTKNTIVQNF